LRTLKELRDLRLRNAALAEIEASLLKLAWTLPFTVKNSRKFQTWWFFLNPSAGHSKRCGGPHVSRGPLIVHPCFSLFTCFFTIQQKTFAI